MCCQHKNATANGSPGKADNKGSLPLSFASRQSLETFPAASGKAPGVSFPSRKRNRRIFFTGSPNCVLPFCTRPFSFCGTDRRLACGGLLRSFPQFPSSRRRQHLLGRLRRRLISPRDAAGENQEIISRQQKHQCHTHRQNSPEKEAFPAPCLHHRLSKTVRTIWLTPRPNTSKSSSAGPEQPKVS